ncbi:DNA adenine methylase [Listeria sp. FSL L7-1582]|uniref:DNA adenine methylase n=1 Tax=Listeria portnoyi TaxID=2713504 RepID=UPI00164E495E|nr:DNA adenine methylase [Listeria portnoyi]MBC6308139.1 DNA adenine methylase [Listeria portnoyi]
MKRILNYPGSKWSMAKWIIDHMPRHEVYLEPYFGSGAIFFNKPVSRIETVNDLDSRIVNLFEVIRNKPEELCKAIDYTPLSREEHQKSYIDEGDDVERARRFLVRCWQSIGAKTSDRTGWRSSINVNGTKAYEWSTLSTRIMPIAERLKYAQIENQPACKLIQRYDSPNALIYADPPYPMETRANKRHYAHEMSNDDHVDLLEVLRDHSGYVILSSYENELYNKMLPNWIKEHKVVNAESGAKREEVLYINPTAAQYTGQMTIFENATN